MEWRERLQAVEARVEKMATDYTLGGLTLEQELLLIQVQQLNEIVFRERPIVFAIDGPLSQREFDHIKERLTEMLQQARSAVFNGKAE